MQVSGGNKHGRGLLYRLVHDEEWCGNCILIFLGILLLALVVCLAAENRSAFGAALSGANDSRTRLSQPDVEPGAGPRAARSIR